MRATLKIISPYLGYSINYPSDTWTFQCPCCETMFNATIEDTEFLKNQLEKISFNANSECDCELKKYVNEYEEQIYIIKKIYGIRS